MEDQPKQPEPIQPRPDQIINEIGKPVTNRSLGVRPFTQIFTWVVLLFACIVANVMFIQMVGLKGFVDMFALIASDPATMLSKPVVYIFLAMVIVTIVVAYSVAKKIIRKNPY